MKVNLEGKNVLVTGAAKRIGREIAIAVAENGGNVAIHYFQSDEEVEKTKESIEQLGAKTTTVQCDLADYAAVKNMKMDLENNFGAIDMIVNNAGYAQLKPFFKYEPGEWQREIERGHQPRARVHSVDAREKCRQIHQHRRRFRTHRRSALDHFGGGAKRYDQLRQIVGERSREKPDSMQYGFTRDDRPRGICRRFRSEARKAIPVATAWKTGRCRQHDFVFAV